MRKSREVHFPPGCASEYLNRVVPTPSVKSLAALVPHRGAWNAEPLVETILCSNQAKVSSSEPQCIVNCIGQCYLFLQIRAGTIPTDVRLKYQKLFLWSPSVKSIYGKVAWNPACKSIVIRIVALGLVPAMGRIKTSNAVADVHER